MTRILLPLFLLTFVVAPFSGSAQITLESSDLTSIGDQILRYVDTIPAFGPGGDGPNQTWDFSAAVNDTLNNTSVVTVASTPFASTFASSTYSMTNDNSSYLYFTHDANSIETTGAAGDLLNNGDQIESPFSDPLTLHQFPRTYMSTFDDTYAFVTEASGNGLPTPIPVYRVRLTHAGHVYDTTDAYGTLITPTGTYDALRVKSVDYTSDLLEYKLFQFSSWTEFGTTTDTSTTYSWHAKEEMLAIAEFSFDSIGNPKRFVYSTVPPAVTTDVASADEHKGWKVFPQPAQDELFISSDHSVAN
ncbi:MAG: hypothetical protein KDB98_12980, partial [Flavobacteriales bacterium]|nr:hypothetical protein [Flavobacteriales bacterium]